MKNSRFLSVANVIQIQRESVVRSGGIEGVSDAGLLESAVNMPAQMFQGHYLHSDLIAMGAAYMFHLCGAHAFLDGNKRVSVLAMLAFFDANDVAFECTNPEMVEISLRLASGKITKDELTDWVREHSAPDER